MTRDRSAIAVLCAKMARLESIIMEMRRTGEKPAPRPEPRKPVRRRSFDHAPIRAIIESVAAGAGMTLSDMVGKARSRAVSRVRQDAMRAALDAGFSAVRVGIVLGGRDHSTVLYGAHRARDRGGK